MPHLRVVRHDRSGGQSRRGAFAACAPPARRSFCTLDGDGQNPPEELPKLRPPCWPTATGQIGLVAGQRVDRQDTWSKKCGVEVRQRPARLDPEGRHPRYRLRAEGVPARGVSGRCPISITCTAICRRCLRAMAGRWRMSMSATAARRGAVELFQPATRAGRRSSIWSGWPGCCGGARRRGRCRTAQTPNDAGTAAQIRRGQSDRCGLAGRRACWGSCAFTARFIVQWIASERAGRSVMPVAFWYLSISAG